MPRSYRLGERAAQVEQTRARLVDAAVALYVERGISAVTMHQVARRADVAPGTALNHFPSKDALDQAVAARALRELALPVPDVIDAGAPLEARMAALSREVGAFIVRGATWYRMWLREPMLSGPWQAAGLAAGAAWDAVFRTALGRLADDRDAMAVVRAAMQPPFFEALMDDARSSGAAADLAAAAVTPWLEARERLLD